MTTPYLTRLKELSDRATKGPWAYLNTGFEAGIVSDLRPAKPGEHSTLDCGFKYDKMIAGGDPHEGWRAKDADALFIIESRTALPALISYIEELEKTISELREKLNG